MEKVLVQAIEQQINEEFYSAYFYMGMHVHFVNRDLDGCAHWVKVQSQEEVMHAYKLMKYLQDRDASFELKSIERVDTTYGTPISVFQTILEHEKKVTKSFNELMSLSKKHDHVTESFLSWFLLEQVEEESNVKGIIGKLQLIKDDGQGLLLLDKELGERPEVSMIDMTSEK